MKYLYIILLLTLGYTQVSLAIQNVDADAGTLDIYMINGEPVGGFQFELLGINITGASAPDGFIAITSSTSVLAFSLTGATIPAGAGILTQVSFTSFNGESICFGEDTGSSGDTAISDGSANYIAADWGDCYCDSAYPADCAGECGGATVEDECGTCDDDASNDCEQDCFDVWGGTDYDQGCGCGVYDQLPTDGCDNACGSTAEVDECFVCGGNNSSCSGCMDNSTCTYGNCACNYDASATIDNGSCNYPLENFNCDGECLLEDGCNDCFGIINGTGKEDDCGECIDCSLYSFGDSCDDHPAWNQSCTDCAGELNGNAFIDACEDCVDGTPNNPACIFDCEGSIGLGSYDNCGECDDNSDNDCEIDCNGDWGGTALIDNCGHCVDGNTGEEACTQDCNGDWGGTAVVDCADECGGTAVLTGCDNVCNSTAVVDCADECGGDAEVDDCGVCDNVPENDCVTLELELKEGANLVSFWALPEDTSNPNIMSSLGENVVMIIGESISAMYNPDEDYWIGSLLYIDSDTGYWIVVNSDVTLTLEEAVPLESDMLYSIHEYNNLISFPIEGAVSLSDGMSNNSGDGGIILVSNGNTVAFYNGNSWEGSLTYFQGGKGYWVMSESSFDMVYNLSNYIDESEFGCMDPDASNYDSNAIISGNCEYNPPELFQYNMSYSAAFYSFDSITINEGEIDSLDWIGAFNGDVCVGARIIKQCGIGSCEVPVMGDVGTEFTTEYMMPGGIPTFKIFDASENVYYNAIASEDMPFENLEIFHIDSLAGDILGCTDPEACNYAETATTDDGSCAYENDECGVCGGDNTACWFLDISTQIGEIQDNYNVLGMHVAAEDGFNSTGNSDYDCDWCYYDLPEPPYFGNYISFYFPHEEDEWQNDFDITQFTSDIRKLRDLSTDIDNPSSVWLSVIETNVPMGEIIIGFDVGNFNLGGNSLIIKYDGTYTTIDMENNATYQFESTGNDELEFIVCGVDIDACGVCGGDGIVDGYNCDGVPELFSYTQSTLQAFYYFYSVIINDVLVDSDDWVGAFNGDICVGARQWDTSQCGGDVCEVPVMGYEGEDTEGYMMTGDIPSFKIYDFSEDTYYDAVASEEFQWAYLGQYMADYLQNGVEGCTDPIACNYDSDANMDDGTCEYAVENYNCEGNCIVDVDCAGECGGSHENCPGWEDDSGAYQFTATISGGIVLNINGEQMGECDNLNSNGICIDEIQQDMFAAFDATGNVRGVAIVLYPPFGPYQDTPVYEMQMRSNAQGDLLHFKYYDASEDEVLDIAETYEFVINDIIGNVVDPIFFNIGSSDSVSPEEFAFNQSSSQAFYFVMSGTDMYGDLLEAGDWIGLFNGDVCVGSREWPGEAVDVPAMGLTDLDGDGTPDPWTEGYLQEGDIPTFKIYDVSEDMIYSAFPSNNFAFADAQIFFVDEISGMLCYELLLDAGANLISFYTLPDDNSIENVIGEYPENITGILAEGMAAAYIDDQWIGTLIEIDLTDGYWILANNLDTLSGCGTNYDPGRVYDLHYGANLISYSSLVSADLSSSIPDDVEDLFLGILSGGSAAMNTDSLGWVGSLTTFDAGVGYWIIVSDDLSFSYETGSMARLEIRRYIETRPSGSVFEVAQSPNQAFYFVDTITLDEGVIEDGDWLLSYNGHTLTGIRQWQGVMIDIPAMGLSESRGTEGYLENGDMPTFKLFKQSTGELIPLGGDIPSWTENGMFMVSSLTQVIVPVVYSLSQAYPNPFNPTTTLSFAIPVDSDVSLSIYNLQGREVSTLMDANMDAGYHSVVWNADSYSSGVYFVKMVAGEYVNTQKLMLIK